MLWSGNNWNLQKKTLQKHLDRTYSFQKTIFKNSIIPHCWQLSVAPVGLQKQKMVVYRGAGTNSKAQVHFLTLPPSHSINSSTSVWFRYWSPKSQENILSVLWQQKQQYVLMFWCDNINFVSSDKLFLYTMWTLRFIHLSWKSDLAQT